MSSLYGLYDLGYTRVTMVTTNGNEEVILSKTSKIT